MITLCSLVLLFTLYSMYKVVKCDDIIELSPLVCVMGFLGLAAVFICIIVFLIHLIITYLP